MIFCSGKSVGFLEFFWSFKSAFRIFIQVFQLAFDFFHAFQLAFGHFYDRYVFKKSVGFQKFFRVSSWLKRFFRLFCPWVVRPRGILGFQLAVRIFIKVLQLAFEILSDFSAGF